MCRGRYLFNLALFGHLLRGEVDTYNTSTPLFASLVAQLVKNPPAMQETLVRFLGQEDPLEKG